MPRRNLDQTAGVVLHVMNRGARRLRLFDTPEDYRAFLRVLSEGRQRTGMRILAYCVMPNHFHLVVWPREAGQLPVFMGWFQGTHGRRWHSHRKTKGSGAVYQSRYRAFPVQTDAHFLTVCRYVERNPVRARLVDRAQDWPWSSLAERCRKCDQELLDAWPIQQPEAWLEMVNVQEKTPDLSAVRRSLARGRAFGTDEWATAVNERLRK
jgi:putative transposase